MSAPLVLTAEQLSDLAGALRMLTQIRTCHNVSVTPFQNAELQIGESTVSVAWDDGAGEYVIDDRNGQ